MPWPQSTEYNAAIQNLRSSVSDDELRGGRAAVNSLGLPLVWSGNFADVYKIECPATGNTWALKCFTREVAGQRERYQRIAEHLERARLPFMVDFDYLEQGVRVRGRWFPALKMRWVTGLSLNQFVEDHLDRPKGLKQLLSLWVKLAARLREAEVAHADLQHGNVLLVPHNVGQLALRLIDYDGMYVPELAGTQSGEVGHPAYQHPQRVREGIYNAEVDRFSHLAIYSAVRCLTVAPRNLWSRFNTGENLLFTESDFRDPASSDLFHTLWELDEPNIRALVGRLALACRRPLEKVPLLSDVLSNGPVLPLPPGQRSAVASLLGHQQPLSSKALTTEPDDSRSPGMTPPPLGARDQPAASPDLRGVAETPEGGAALAHQQSTARRVVRVALGALLSPVRCLDASLRRLAGPDNRILHGFLRLVALVVLVGLAALGIGYSLTPAAPAVYYVELVPADAELTVRGERATVSTDGSHRTITVLDPDGQSEVVVIACKGAVELVRRGLQPIAGEETTLRMVLPAVYDVELAPPDAELSTRGERVAITGTGSQRTLTIAEPDGQRKSEVTAALSGYEPLTQEVRPQPGESHRLVFRLEPLPATYALSVNPPEAKVTVTGKGATIEGNGRDRTIKVAKPDGQATVEVTAELRGHKSLKQELHPKPGESRPLELRLQVIDQAEGLRGIPPVLNLRGLRAVGGRVALNLPPQRTARDPALARGGPRGFRYAVLTGLVPKKEQERLYDDYFRDRFEYDPERDVPQYLWYAVERAEVRATKAPAEADSAPLDLNQAVAISRLWRGRGVARTQALVDQKYVHPRLTFPLPPRVSGSWGEEVAYPDEIPLPSPERRGLDEGEYMGVPAAEGPGIPGVPETPGGAETPGIPEGVAVPRLPGEEEPTQTPESTMMEPLEPDHLLFRFFDFTVEPGKKYRYRVKLWLVNPNYGMDPRFLEAPTLSKLRYIDPEKWTEPTDVVEIPLDSHVLLLGLKPPLRTGDEPSAKLGIVQWVSQSGVTVYEDFEGVGRGGVLDFAGYEFPGGKIVEEEERPQPRPRDDDDRRPRRGRPRHGSSEGEFMDEPIAPLEKVGRRPGMSTAVPVDYLTGAIVLDIRGGDRISQQSSDRRPGELLLLRADGSLRIHYELDDVRAYEQAKVLHPHTELITKPPRRPEQPTDPHSPPEVIAQSPEDVEISTSDGLVLKATYYPGSKGKDSVPVVLLHELRGRHERDQSANTRFSRLDYAGLAKYLQVKGHAVLVPDLRGHGESNVRKTIGRPDEVIDPKTMGATEYQRMVAVDMPALKNFLVERNNDGELNIEKLVVVGAEESALLAMCWAQLDWSIPASGDRKQGQDIKAVILLSPQWTVPGLQWGQISDYQPLAMIPFDQQLQRVFRDGVRRDPRQGSAVFDYRKEVPVRVLVGWYDPSDHSDKPPAHVREAMADAHKIRNLFKSFCDALLDKFDTKAQGTELLKVPGLRTEQIVANLIDRTVGSRQLAWDKRIDPFRGEGGR